MSNVQLSPELHNFVVLLSILLFVAWVVSALLRLQSIVDLRKALAEDNVIFHPTTAHNNPQIHMMRN